MKIELPWMPSVLNPNKKAHWATKAKAAKDYKERCRQASFRLFLEDFPEGNIPMTITFHPPSKRKMDDDNMIAAFKHGRDGVARAWNVDDNRFKPAYSVGEPVKGGKVVICVD